MTKDQAKKAAAAAAKKGSASVSKPKRGLFWLLGFTDLKRGFMVQAETIAESGQRMKTLAGHYKAALEKARKPGRRETFEQAVERLQLSEAHLERRRFQFSLEGWCSTIAALGVFYLLCRYVFSGELVSAVPTLCAVLWLSALSFRGFFRAWQVRERRLDGPRDFIRDAIGL